MSSPSSSSDGVPVGGVGGVGGGGGGVTVIDLTLLDSDSSDSDSDHHRRPSQGVGGESQGRPSSSTDDQRRGGRLGPQHEGEDVGFRFEEEAEEDQRVPGWRMRNGNSSSPRSRRSGSSPSPDDENAGGRRPAVDSSSSAVARASAPTLDGGDCLMTTSNESGVRPSPSGNRPGGCDEEEDEGEDDEDGDFPTRFRNTADAAEDDWGSGDFPTRVRVMEAVLDYELLGPESNDASASSVVGIEGQDEGRDVVRREKSQRRREAERRRRKRRRERERMARAAASSSESKTGDGASRGDRRGGNNGVGHYPPLGAASSDVEWGNRVEGDRRHLDGTGVAAAGRTGRLPDDDSHSTPVPSVPATGLDPPRWLGGEMGKIGGKGKKRRRPMVGMTPPPQSNPSTPETKVTTTPPRCRRHRRFDEPCRFFAMGRCMRGKKCWYRHGDDEGGNDDDIAAALLTTTTTEWNHHGRNGDDVPGPPEMMGGRAEVDSSSAGASSSRGTTVGRSEDGPSAPTSSTTSSIPEIGKNRNVDGSGSIIAAVAGGSTIGRAVEDGGAMNGDIVEADGGGGGGGSHDSSSSAADCNSSRRFAAGGMKAPHVGGGRDDDNDHDGVDGVGGPTKSPADRSSGMRNESSSSAGTSSPSAPRQLGRTEKGAVPSSSRSVAQGCSTMNSAQTHPPTLTTAAAAAEDHSGEGAGGGASSSHDGTGTGGDLSTPSSSSSPRPTRCEKGGGRRWRFTIRHTTDDEVGRVRRILCDGVSEGEVRYAVFGLVDRVASSTLMRGYVSFRLPRRLAGLGRFFSSVVVDERGRGQRFEFEPAVGDERRNLDLIRGGDRTEEERDSRQALNGPNNGSVPGRARVEEFGERAAPGRRTDLERKRMAGVVPSDADAPAPAAAAASSEVTCDTNDAVDNSTHGGGAVQLGQYVETGSFAAGGTHGTPPECIDLTGCDGLPVENDGADDDWNAMEVNLMLDVVETNLPRGNEMWEAVAMDYNRSATADGARRRSASQIRSMFESLVNSDGKAGEKRKKDGRKTSDGSETVVSVIDIVESSDESGIDGGESLEPSINTDGQNQSAVDPGMPVDYSTVDVIFVKVVATPAQVRLARKQAAANVRRVDLDSPKLQRAPAPRPKLKFKPRPHAKKRRSRSVSTDILDGSEGKEREDVRRKTRSRSLSTDASVSSVATDGVDLQQHQEKKHKTSHQDASGATSVAYEGSHVQSNGSMKGTISCDVPVVDKDVYNGLEKRVCDSSNASEGEAQVSSLNGKVDVKVSVAVDASSVPMEGEASSEAGGDSCGQVGPISSSAIAGSGISSVGEGQRPSHAINELVVRFAKSDLLTKDGRQNPLGIKISRVRLGKEYYHVVKSVERGSPAEIKGITANLAICSINGHMAEHMKLMDARTWRTALSNLANGEGETEGSSLEICFRNLGASQNHTDAKENESTNFLSQAGDNNSPSHASTTRTEKDAAIHSSASVEYGTTDGGGLSRAEVIDLSSPSELNIDQKTESSTSSNTNVAEEIEPRAPLAAGDTNAKKKSGPKKTRKPKRKKPVNERAWTHYNFNKKIRQYSSTEAYRFSSGQDRHFHCPVEDALREQERLLSESAARVRGRMEAERLMALSSTSDRIRYFSLPVSNMRDLPDSHWTWSDPYSRLGLPRSSSALLVKRHYRKLALMYHPDKSRRPDALDRFHAIKEAYELLTKHSAVPSQVYHS